jgi:hypothetical protein
MRRPGAVRSRAWLAALAIVVGISIVYTDVLYVVMWPTTHPSGGFDIRVIMDDYFDGEVTTMQPVAEIVLGDVNRVTLEDLEIVNATDLSLVLTDRDNQTLLSVTHPQQVDLQNHSLTCWTDVRLGGDNVTLRIVRGPENTAFTLRIIAEKVTPRPLVLYFYPLILIMGGLFLGFGLVGWGCYIIQYIVKTAWD